MYKLIVTTKYNEIELIVDFPPEIDEILAQPYVIDVKVEKIKDNEIEEGGKKL